MSSTVLSGQVLFDLVVKRNCSLGHIFVEFLPLSSPEDIREYHGEVKSPEVKKIRDLSGLTQGNFARLISVNITTVTSWEQGVRSATGTSAIALRMLKELLEKRSES